MNFKTIALLFILIVCVGAFAALAFIDVPVAQEEINKAVNYEPAAP